MKRLLLRFAICLAALTSTLSHAQGKIGEVISVDLNRESRGKPVVMSALVSMAPQPNGKALLLFPGWPGIPRIEDRDGTPSFYYLQQHFEEMRPTLHAAGISTVTIDCPTDQWGIRAIHPTACDDNYRASPLHAQDVAALIAKIKTEKGLQHITIMGHSYGAVSSHWLSLHLDKGEIQAAIHSASKTEVDPGAFVNYGSSMARFDHSKVKVPYVYLHHQDDLCRNTPYSYAKKHAVQGQLITVTGGNRFSAPCGGASYHGFAGRRPQVADALVAYINRSEVIPTVKGD